jgi:plastocyanin
MRKLLVLVLIAAVLGILAATAFGATKSVTVGDNYFVRKSGVPTVTVRKGDTVVWRFRGDAPHNVSVTRGPSKFRSSTRSSGTYRKKVTRRGTYTIICTVHGASDQSMKLRVR